ncbi:putative endo-beta-14-glucanase D [Fusarium albosuccineum]|uniref:lytic cellulose monooxygenase (C4-dehydrogenating) n=1 Tax=Fusarium albosuccineum TaxID=1237068 RepID=A0A8H4P0N8_9HYPO|nr:putative endo-beta-14-glucanase D [Fusarium albosuccineum]
MYTIVCELAGGRESISSQRTRVAAAKHYAELTQGTGCVRLGAGFNHGGVTVPSDTPAGEYLVRVEHIGLHGAHNGEAEFYYACAQVKVTGNGSGTPGPTVKIPGIYSTDDASVNFSIWSDNTNYPMPEPAVWTGGSSPSGSDQEQSAQNSSSVTQQITKAITTEETVPVSTEEALGAKASSEGSSGCRAQRRTRRGHQNIHAGYRR